MIVHSKCGRVDIVRYLLYVCAKVNAKTNDRYTTLHLAFTVEIAKSLIEHGAEIEAIDHMRYTPLIYHSHRGRVDIVNYLIGKGANKEDKTKYNITAYDLACCGGPNSMDKKQVKAELQKILK